MPEVETSKILSVPWAEAVLDFWLSGGILLIPLAIIGWLIWQRYFQARAEFRSALVVPDSFSEEFERRWKRGKDASDLDAWLSTLPGAVVVHVRNILLILRRGGGMDEAVPDSRALLSELEHRSFEGLAALVAAAPLVGLLGTILGMIETFHGVSLRSGETAALVAAGISKALITTQVGLAVALPGAFGIAHLRRLRQALANRLDLAETQLRILNAKNFSKKCW
ncbi:MAG: MotA/TolQ/ExbB proton channel family protein [Verrucomicrobiota bacterium]